MTDNQSNIENITDTKINKKEKNNLYATGKRKDSIARVWLVPKGKGDVIINKKDSNKYFTRSLSSIFFIVKKALSV